MNKEGQRADQRPHSPYVQERETLDSGFSRGWGFHFPPSEEYWVDCHTHLHGGKTANEILRVVDKWFGRLAAYRLGTVLFICDDLSSFTAFKLAAEADRRFRWIVWLPFDRPDSELFREAIESGAVGLKLHNSPIMRGQGDPKCWLSSEWDEIFKRAEGEGIPVVWHVTQRVSKSPYHGGGFNSYWSEGQQKGVTFTNENLLGIMEQVLSAHPSLNIIGAHQLHVGLERLSSLMAEHANLSIDSSCGFYLRWADNLYEDDRRTLWDFFQRHSERILFGTDSGLAPGIIDESLIQGFLCHARFISQLRLPYDTLQRVAHENAERLFGVGLVDTARKGNVRP